MSRQDTWVGSSVVSSAFSVKEMLSNLPHQLNYWRQIINTTQIYIAKIPNLTDINKVEIA